MRQESEQHPNRDPSRDRLPEGFGEGLHAIDRRIGRLAAHVVENAPDGLADQVYHASVADLPSIPAKPESRWRPRLVSREDRRRDRLMVATGWGRLGLAAALGFAFVVACLFMDGPRAQPAGELMALDIEWLDEDPLDQVDAQVAHILDTDALTSVTEVTGELESLLASLEM